MAVLFDVSQRQVDRIRRRGRMVVIVVMLRGAAIAVFGLVHVLWIGLFCVALAGATDVISTILRNTILQSAISDEYRSRISSTSWRS